MEKYKKLNEDVLNDEKHPELLDLMRNIATELEDTMHKYKAIAKAKGQRYLVAAAKQDAIESEIAGRSLEGSSL